MQKSLIYPNERKRVPYEHSDRDSVHEVAVQFKRYVQDLAGIALDLSPSLLLLLGLSFSLNETLYVLWEVFHVEVLCTQS